MRISGIEPSSVIFSQTKDSERVDCDAFIKPKVAAKKDGIIQSQNCNFDRF